MTKEKLERFAELSDTEDIPSLIREAQSFSLVELEIEGRFTWGILLDDVLLAQVDDKIEAMNTFKLLTQSVYTAQTAQDLDGGGVETTNIFGFPTKKFES